MGGISSKYLVFKFILSYTPRRYSGDSLERVGGACNFFIVGGIHHGLASLDVLTGGALLVS